MGTDKSERFQFKPVARISRTKSDDARKLSLLSDEMLIPLEDVAITVAKLVHPHLDLNAAKKRIREQVDYARKHGLIETTNIAGELHVNREQTLQWLLKKWPELAATLNIPIIGHLDATLPSPSPEIYGTTVPKTVSELTRQFIELNVTVQKQAEEIAECNSKLNESEQDLLERRRRDIEISAKQSAAGKRGGRGNEL